MALNSQLLKLLFHSHCKSLWKKVSAKCRKGKYRQQLSLANNACRWRIGSKDHLQTQTLNFLNFIKISLKLKTPFNCQKSTWQDTAGESKHHQEVFSLTTMFFPMDLFEQSTNNLKTLRKLAAVTRLQNKSDMPAAKLYKILLKTEQKLHMGS